MDNSYCETAEYEQLVMGSCFTSSGTSSSSSVKGEDQPDIII